MAHVNEGSYSITCHPQVYPQVEWTIPAFTPQPQSITALWLAFISRPTEGRRLSWTAWLGEILRRFIRRRRSPISVLTRPDVVWLRWYAQECYRYATLPHNYKCQLSFSAHLILRLDNQTTYILAFIDANWVVDGHGAGNSADKSSIFSPFWMH